MAPEFGVGFANYSLRTCLGKFRMVNGISSITDVRVIPPWLGDVCVYIYIYIYIETCRSFRHIKSIV